MEENKTCPVWELLRRRSGVIGISTVSDGLTIQVSNEVVSPCDVHHRANWRASQRERMGKECRRVWITPTAVHQTTSCSSNNNAHVYTPSDQYQHSFHTNTALIYHSTFNRFGRHLSHSSLSLHICTSYHSQNPKVATQKLTLQL